MTRFLPAVCVLLSASAQTIKTLDLSTTSTNKKFYVIFAARGGSLTGHAFAMWGMEDGIRKRSTIRAFGLYPENSTDACQSVFSTTAGTIVDESTNHSILDVTDELIIQVDQSYYDISMKVARRWQCKHEFSLLSRDCVEFIRAVAKSLYLEVPRRTILQMAPRAYVRALMASVTTGIVTLTGDSTYDGTMVNDKPMGHGVLMFPDGSRIEGAFWGLDNVVGTGDLMLANGNRYDGGIVNYKASGEGTLFDADSKPILSGKFENGELKSLARDFTATRVYFRNRKAAAERAAADFGVIEHSPSEKLAASSK